MMQLQPYILHHQQLLGKIVDLNEGIDIESCPNGSAEKYDRVRLLSSPLHYIATNGRTKAQRLEKTEVQEICYCKHPLHGKQPCSLSCLKHAYCKILQK